ncbi:hypothetical protein GGF31_002673 [Allomyces arbusculus]|nr:hypothetical protein GGF31_002673 [Allomyces arbusculus]
MDTDSEVSLLLEDDTDRNDPTGHVQHVDTSRGAPTTASSSDNDASATLAADLAALLAKPWYRRGPIVILAALAFFVLVAFMACVPAVNQATLDWACDFERMHDGTVIGDATECKSDPHLAVRVQKRASGLLSTGLFWMGIISMLTTSFWGHLCDTHGRVFIVRVGFLAFMSIQTASLAVVTAPTSAVAPIYYTMYIFAGLCGGMGASMLGLKPYVSDMTFPHERPAVFGAIQGAIMLGVVAAPIAGGTIISVVGGRPAPLLISALVVLIVAFLVSGVLREVRPPAPSTASLWDRVWKSNPLSALFVLAPSRRPGAIYRLFLIIFTALTTVADLMSSVIWMLFVTYHFAWTPSSTGALLTARSALAAVLVMASGPAIRFVAVSLRERAPVPPRRESDARAAVDETDVDSAVNSSSSSSRTSPRLDPEVNDDKDDADASTPLLADHHHHAADHDEHPGPPHHYDDALPATRWDTPILAFTAFINVVALNIMGTGRTATIFTIGYMTQSLTTLAVPVRDTLLSKLVPGTQLGQLMAANQLITSFMSAVAPALANAIYAWSLQTGEAGAGSVNVLAMTVDEHGPVAVRQLVKPGGMVFVVAAMFALVAFVLAAGVAVWVRAVRAKVLAVVTATA